MAHDHLSIKEQRLIDLLGQLGGVIVAYSGGVDSSLLAYYARNVLADRALIVIAISPSLAGEELEAARAQALAFNWALIEIDTDEVARPEYQRNDAMRCYFCKAVLFERLDVLADKQGIHHVAYGANVDDLRDFRPGHKAAREHKVLSPLQEAALTKEEIRTLARKADLPSWDRPQAACLSSRFPTFTPVTIDGLAQVERAERYLHSLGFRQVRVRHHGDLARIEVDRDELPRLTGDRQLLAAVTSALVSIGYRQVELDMEGYRQGSSNIVAGKLHTGKEHRVDQ